MTKGKKDTTPEVPLDETELRDEADAEAKAELEAELGKEAESKASAAAVLEKERLKEVLKAKYRDEIRGRLEAEYAAKQDAELQQMAEDEAKAEAEAEEKARLTKATSNDWKKMPSAEMRRVFRSETVPAKASFVTLMQRKTVVNGTEMDEQTRSVPANRANQYILEDGAIEYQQQLKAFRKLEGVGYIKEVAPSSENIPYIPEALKKLQAARALVKQLEKQL